MKQSRQLQLYILKSDLISRFYHFSTNSDLYSFIRFICKTKTF